MITENESNALREIIGSKHAAKVTRYLKKNKIFNRYGNPYSTQYVSQVFCGAQNDNIEKAIWDFAEKVKREKAEEEKRKAEILKPINPPKK